MVYRKPPDKLCAISLHLTAIDSHVPGVSMYLVTGGAGFIGSNIVAQLSDGGADVIVCDWMKSDERWRNLAKHEIATIISPSELRTWLAGRHDRITAPYSGFASAVDYYYRASAARVVDRIAVPTLILYAIDDPFIVLTPPELRDALRQLAEKIAAMAARSN